MAGQLNLTKSEATLACKKKGIYTSNIHLRGELIAALSSNTAITKPLPSQPTKNKIRALIAAGSTLEQLQPYIDSYEWSPAMKKLMAARTLKLEPSHSSPPTGYSITYQELLAELDNPRFIDRFTASVMALMDAKLKFYNTKLEEMKKEFKFVEAKMNMLKDLGLKSSDVKDLYPDYLSLFSYIVDIEEIVVLVARHKKSTTTTSIKKGLKEALEDPDEGVASLIGRDAVKNAIALQLYSFASGPKTTFSFNNARIYGEPGVGKTTLAKVLGFVASRVGILAKNIVKIVTRVNLVGQYIGQTAPRTLSILMATLESVLFIDEAPLLVTSDGSKDFGAEALGEIVNFLDKYIGMSIVIVAGYRDGMEKHFMPFNKGLERRFPFLYVLDAYSVKELCDILASGLKKRGIDIEVFEGFLRATLTTLQNGNALANHAGDMLNLAAALERSIRGAYKLRWGENTEGDKKILLEGINSFLGSKQLRLH